MTNQEIVNYVMNTPQNTNPAILQQMLKEQDLSEEQYDLVIEYQGRLAWDFSKYSKEDIKPIPQEKIDRVFQKMSAGIVPKILFKISYTDGSPAYLMSIPLLVSYYSHYDNQYAACYGKILFDEEGLVEQTIHLIIFEDGIQTDIFVYK